MPVEKGNHLVRRYRIDYRPASRIAEAETNGRKESGNGSGRGGDERALGAQLAELSITGSN